MHMKNDLTYPLFFAPFHIWANYAWKVGELTLASSQVVSQRSCLLLRSGGAPTVADQRELTLMSQEKYAAAAESAQAMALGYMNLAPQMAMLAFRQMLGGLIPLTTFMTLHTFPLLSRQSRTAYESFARSTTAANQVSRSIEKIASRGLKPIHARARANAKRLNRKAT
jgi:hypothetical protein